MLRLDRQSHMPLYLQIVDQIKAQIADGTLRVGDRIASTRQLADENNLHRNTVSAAFEELAADGIIRSHVGKGTFIIFNPGEGKRPSPQQTSPFEHVWESLGQHQKDDVFSHLIPQGYPQSWISFANAEPLAELFPLRKINRVVNDVFRVKRTELIAYGEAAGYRPLRERLAEKMRGSGVKTTAEEVLITNGCQQALSVICQTLVRPGELIFIENPTYPGALRVFQQSEIQCVGIPVTSEGMDLDRLEGLLQHQRPRLIHITPTFHNPTGHTMSLEHRRRLLSLAVRYGVPVIEDDIYSDLRYEGQPVPSLKSLDDAGAVIYMSSFSKVGFGGLRVGWLVAPPVAIDHLTAVKETQDLHTNVLGQAILSELVHGSLFTRHLKKIRHEYALRRDAMTHGLMRHFPEEAGWITPEGGLSMWITLPRTIDANRLLSLAVQQGVIFSPGVRFYLTGALHHTMRLTFTLKEMEKIEEGVRILGAILKQMLVRAKQRAQGSKLQRASLV